MPALHQLLSYYPLREVYGAPHGITVHQQTQGNESADPIRRPKQSDQLQAQEITGSYAAHSCLTFFLLDLCLPALVIPVSFFYHKLGWNVYSSEVPFFRDTFYQRKVGFV